MLKVNTISIKYARHRIQGSIWKRLGYYASYTIWKEDNNNLGNRNYLWIGGNGSLSNCYNRGILIGAEVDKGIESQLDMERIRGENKYKKL